MEKGVNPFPPKTANEEFLERFAGDLEADGLLDRRKKNKADVAERTWRALAKSVEAELADGRDVMLPGFGRFYVQMHKGHSVQFGGGRISDYPVFKFRASSVLNKRLRGEGDG